jgi:hypothetical protein
MFKSTSLTGISKWAFVSIVVSFSTVLIFLFVSFAQRPMNASASTTETWYALASTAAKQEVNFVETPNGYRHLKSEEMNLITSVNKNNQPFSVLIPKTREVWIAKDGSGRIHETEGKPIFLGERDRNRWQAAGSPSLGSAMDKDFAPNGLSFTDFSRLPTDPDALAAIILGEADNPSGPPVNVGMFVVLGDYLRQLGASRELRSALFKVAAKIEGVESIGKVTDRLGRQGVALAVTTDHWGGKQRLMLVFDPITSMLLEEQKILLEPVGWLDAKPPVVIGYQTYLESTVVPKLP